jgi:kynurenine 3-monooxygenase
MSKVTINGAGLVGSLLAIALKKRGHEVAIFEKRSDPRAAKKAEGRSINLILTSRGLHALDGVGLKEQALQLTVPVYGRLMHSLDRSLQYQPYGRDQSECNYSVSRSDLNNFLIDQAQKMGVHFTFNAELENLDRQHKTLTFKGGLQSSFEFLIATDGAGSIVRRSLEEQNVPLNSSVDFINADYKELFMPLDEHGQPKLKTEALHIWPRGRHMLMALPNLDGSFTMTIYLPPDQHSPNFGELQNPDSIRNYLAQQFPDALELMPNAIEEFQKNPQGRLGTVRLQQWSDGDSIALLGDASHAIVPFFGQGMNSGFEDVSEFIELLEQNGEDFRLVFSKLTQSRLPNTNAIADMALENFIEMCELVGDPRFLLKKKIEHAIELAYPNLYRSRYGMICYTLIPYKNCLEIGLLQEQILQSLLECTPNVEALNLSLAKEKIHEVLLPYMQRQNFQI